MEEMNKQEVIEVEDFGTDQERVNQVLEQLKENSDEAIIFVGCKSGSILIEEYTAPTMRALINNLLVFGNLCQRLIDYEDLEGTILNNTNFDHVAFYSVND